MPQRGAILLAVAIGAIGAVMFRLGFAEILIIATLAGVISAMVHAQRHKHIDATTGE